MMWSEARAIGHLVFVEAAPGIITVLPEWMLDPIICAGMELGTPRAAAEALINLQRQLSDGGFRRSPPDDSIIVPEERAQYTEVAALQTRGWSQSRIARTLGLDRKTVRVWLRAGQPPSWSQPAKGSLLDAHVDYLRGRWSEGCWNATQLWREIRQRGFSGQSRIVRDWVRGLRVNEPAAHSAAKSTWRVPSGRRAAWLVAARPEEIDRTEQAFVAALIAGSPSLERVIHLARTFRDIVSGQKADQLDGWLAAARGTPLAGFANGLQRDLPAVRAALSLRWSTSPVEGQINRLKSVKRQMYGRAGFDLLRQQVLGTA